jgi:hypothetical protein
VFVSLYVFRGHQAGNVCVSTSHALMLEYCSVTSPGYLIILQSAVLDRNPFRHLAFGCVSLRIHICCHVSDSFPVVSP